MTRFRWMRFFLWVPLFGLLAGLGSLAAHTQVFFAYEHTGRGYGYAGLQGRHYTRCTYVGLPGASTVPAEAGRCGWLRLYRAGGR